MANFIYGAISLTGGGFGALDGIDGNKLLDEDNAIGFVNGTVYFYQLDANSSLPEDIPNVIIPDLNPGDKRWILLTRRSWKYVVNEYTTSGIIADDSDVVLGNTAGGGMSLTLPSAALKDSIRIQKTSATGVLTILAAGSDSIEGNSSIDLIALDDSVILLSNGNNRWVEY